MHELSRRLTRQFRVTVLCPHAKNAAARENSDGVTVVRYRYAPQSMETLVNDGGIVTNLKRHPWKWLLVPGFVLAQLLVARRLMRRERFDIIHAHWLLPQGLIARVLSRTTDVPYVVTSHGGDLFGLKGWLPDWLKRGVAGSAAAMTVVSTAMSEEVVRLRLSPRRLEVLPMGVDFSTRFVPDPAIQRDTDHLLFVGRLVPKKGLPLLLQALPQVLDERPGTRLTIVGFGPEEAALRSQARSLGLESVVHFAGALAQYQLPDLYRRATLFVAPFVRDRDGNQEGLPVVLMEAIGCGCPAVVGEVAGIRDLLGDAQDDVCVDPRVPGALATAVLAALHNPDRARLQADRIRRAAAMRVDWEVVSGGYARVLLAHSSKNGISAPRDLSDTARG